MAQITKKKPKSETRKRAHKTGFRIDDAELKIFKDNAAAAGLSLGDYFRSQCCGVKPQRTRRVGGQLDEKMFIMMQAQLGKWGSNLNQIAKAINKAMKQDQIGTLSSILRDKSGEIETLSKTVTECYSSISKIIKHVPKGQHD